jgi:hypothetical protein
MTIAQIESIDLIKQRWDIVGDPQSIIGGDGAVCVKVESIETGYGMWIAIETDGHRHS